MEDGNKNFLENIQTALKNGEKNEIIDKLNTIAEKAEEKSPQINENNDKVEKNNEYLSRDINESVEILNKILSKYNEIVELCSTINMDELDEKQKKILDDIKNRLL
ncbi:MAG: hypothetical protein ACOC2W_04905 [bacterium]